MGAFEVLVLILSIFLAIFLIVGIAVLVELLKFTRRLNEMSEKADHYMDELRDTVLGIVKKTVTPSMIMSGIVQFMRNTRRRDK